MVTNENEPKKRSRLFGGRKAATDATPVVAPAETEPEPAEAPKAPRTRAPKATAPAKSAADHVNAGATGPADSDVEPEAEQAAPRRRSAPKKAAAEASVPEVQTAPKRPATTSLLFQAPDLPPLPPVRATRNGNGPALDLPEEAGTVRRRSRRRPGEDARPGDEAPNTVVRVRQPRPEPVLSNEPTRVKGSTRLEAKKQRRRDGRDAGRRRPVVTESEFLARRESVDRVMVVRSKFDRIQIAVLEDNVLVEHYVAKSQDASLIGNVYLGRVQNVLPSMEAAFVDIGRGRNAVLYAGEIDWNAFGVEGDARKVERFQNEADRPFRRINGAAAILDEAVFAETDMAATNGAAHFNQENLRLLVIRGPSLMKLVHTLYERAADEA